MVFKESHKMFFKKSKICIAAALSGLTFFTYTAFAGMKEGLEAYDRKDYAVAVREFHTLAIQGDTSAQVALALMYVEGAGVPKDSKKAAQWFRSAADLGDAFAQRELGVMYAHGKGVPKDEQQGLKWFLKAADQGNINAQTNLVYMYRLGIGGPIDLKEAYFWALLVSVDGEKKIVERRNEIEAHLSVNQRMQVQARARNWIVKPTK